MAAAGTPARDALNDNKYVPGTRPPSLGGPARVVTNDMSSSVAVIICMVIICILSVRHQPSRGVSKPSSRAFAAGSGTGSNIVEARKTAL